MGEGGGPRRTSDDHGCSHAFFGVSSACCVQPPMINDEPRRAPTSQRRAATAPCAVSVPPRQCADEQPGPAYRRGRGPVHRGSFRAHARREWEHHRPVDGRDRRARAARPDAVRHRRQPSHRRSRTGRPTLGPGLREAYGATGFTRERAIDAQLARLGHRLTDVTHVIYSHLHLDHAGGMAYFPDAVHVAQHEELRHAWWPDRWTARGYALADYASGRGFDFLELSGDLDLFGDGSIQLFRTPGHTPGHQGLLMTCRIGAVKFFMDYVTAKNRFRNANIYGRETIGRARSLLPEAIEFRPKFCRCIPETGPSKTSTFTRISKPP